MRLQATLTDAMAGSRPFRRDTAGCVLLPHAKRARWTAIAAMGVGVASLLQLVGSLFLNMVAFVQ